jgi:hypothetical protein
MLAEAIGERHTIVSVANITSVLLSLATTAAPAAAAAQPSSTFTFDGTIGWGTGTTNGEYLSNDDGYTADILVAGRVRPVGTGSVVVGMSVGGFASGPYASICLLGSDGDCIPAFPAFLVVAPLAGWEDARGMLRVMAGAGYATASEDMGAGLALSTRADVGMPLWGRVGLVVSLRASLLPNMQRDAFLLYAFGFGIRIR